jgi:hypothetical protein
MEVLYYKVLWWVLEIVVHATFIACMIGIGMFILWATRLLPCRHCRARDRDLKRRFREAMANPTLRSEQKYKTASEWMDECIRLNTKPKSK